jgi:hypothetical protein
MGFFRGRFTFFINVVYPTWITMGSYDLGFVPFQMLLDFYILLYFLVYPRKTYNPRTFSTRLNTGVCLEFPDEMFVLICCFWNPQESNTESRESLLRHSSKNRDRASEKLALASSKLSPQVTRSKTGQFAILLKLNSHQLHQNRLLCMHAVFGLVEYDAVFAFQGLVGDLLAAVGG